jgi:hypothetical protein
MRAHHRCMEALAASVGQAVDAAAARKLRPIGQVCEIRLRAERDAEIMRQRDEGKSNRRSRV